MIHKYSAAKDGSNYTLYKDGEQVFCPKLQPMPMQGKLGHVEWVRFPCNTACPFANIHKDILSEKHIYKIECDGADVSIQLTEIKERQNLSAITTIGEA